MKTLFKVLAIATALSAMAACDSLNEYPEFKENDAFAAFSESSIEVKEDAGTVSIPVYIASTQKEKVSVTYSVADSSAKKGTNYSLTDQSAVLTFDGTSNKSDIVINIKNLLGTYTGDLIFTVKLESAGNLNIGSENTCTVSITDLDHPLAAILGAYTLKARGYSAWFSQTVTLTKDEKSVSVLWADALVEGAVGSSSWAIYANVSDDKKSISFPCGQVAKVKFSGETVKFYESTMTSSGDFNLVDSGNVVFTQQSAGVWYCPQGYAYASENHLYVDTLVMGESDGGGTTMTKQ